jgi:hypothetical protein
MDDLPYAPTDPPEATSPGARRGLAISRWQIQLLIGILTALVVWPLAAWDPGAEPIGATVAGETLERTDPGSAQAPGEATTTTAAAETTTSTRATTLSAVPPPTALTTTRPPTTAPPTTVATTPTTSTTTTTVPKPPKAIRRQTASQVFSGLQLTLTASAPESGAARIAAFQVSVEFGDTRVLRMVHLDFGDDAGADMDVRAWDCWDPAAPNPIAVSGPTHIYAGAGTYPVVVTVRTGLCVPGQDEPVSEETATLALAVAVS